MIASSLGVNVLGLIGGYIVGCCTPGVIRVIRAKVFGVAKRVETVVQSDIKKL